MFVYRHEYYLERSKPQQRPNENYQNFAARLADHESVAGQKRGLAEVIIAKQRHGPIGDVELVFDANTTTFKNLHKGGS